METFYLCFRARKREAHRKWIPQSSPLWLNFSRVSWLLPRGRNPRVCAPFHFSAGGWHLKRKKRNSTSGRDFQDPLLMASEGSGLHLHLWDEQGLKEGRTVEHLWRPEETASKEWSRVSVAQGWIAGFLVVSELGWGCFADVSWPN